MSDVPEGVAIVKGRARIISEAEADEAKKQEQAAIIKRLKASGFYDKPKDPFSVTIPKDKQPPGKKKPDGTNPFDVSIPEERKE